MCLSYYGLSKVSVHEEASAMNDSTENISLRVLFTQVHTDHPNYTANPFNF